MAFRPAPIPATSPRRSSLGRDPEGVQNLHCEVDDHSGSDTWVRDSAGSFRLREGRRSRRRGHAAGRASPGSISSTDLLAPEVSSLMVLSICEDILERVQGLSETVGGLLDRPSGPGSARARTPTPPRAPDTSPATSDDNSESSRAASAGADSSPPLPPMGDLPPGLVALFSALKAEYRRPQSSGPQGSTTSRGAPQSSSKEESPQSGRPGPQHTAAPLSVSSGPAPSIAPDAGTMFSPASPDTSGNVGMDPYDFMRERSPRTPPGPPSEWGHQGSPPRGSQSRGRGACGRFF
jgi:hypothetical protein